MSKWLVFFASSPPLRDRRGAGEAGGVGVSGLRIARLCITPIQGVGSPVLAWPSRGRACL